MCSQGLLKRKMKQIITLTEQQNARSHHLDQRSIVDLVSLMTAEDRSIPDAVAAAHVSIVATIELLVQVFKHGGRLFYMGAGTSGRLGVLDASECPPTFRTDPEMVQGLMAGGESALVRSVEGAEDREEDAQKDLEDRGLTGLDMVIGIAASGHTPYVRAGLRYAKALGCQTALLTCNPIATDDPAVNEFIIVAVGPEIVTGSTRLKAGTATKLVLNMLTTISMIQLGKVYDNLMVDLQISNKKLQGRAVGMLQNLTGIDYETAESLLQDAQGEVKTALLMQLAALNYADAKVALLQADGHLRRALANKQKE